MYTLVQSFSYITPQYGIRPSSSCEGLVQPMWSHKIKPKRTFPWRNLSHLFYVKSWRGQNARYPRVSKIVLNIQGNWPKISPLFESDPITDLMHFHFVGRIRITHVSPYYFNLRVSVNHHHHHHISFMELGQLSTRSGLTYPEVSSKVSVNKNSNKKKGIISTVYHITYKSLLLINSVFI